jgi:hypothetical protein
MSQENVEIVRSTPVWNPDVQTACVRDVVMPRRRAGTDSDHAPAPWRQGRRFPRLPAFFAARMCPRRF